MPIDNKVLGKYKRPDVYYTGEELYTNYNKVFINSNIVDLDDRFLGVKSHIIQRLVLYQFRFHCDGAYNNFISDLTYSLNNYDRGLVFQIICDKSENENNENNILNATFIFAIPEDNDEIIKFDITLITRCVLKKDLPKLIRKHKIEKLNNL